MNSRFANCDLRLAWLAVALSWTLAVPLSAQNVAIDWFTLDGGGGDSAGGGYTISSTISQPDAGGPMTGGSYSLTGGYWVLPAVVQTPGSPTLTITPGARGFATLSWSPATPGFVLQQSDGLTTTNWSNAPSGAANPTTVPAMLPAKFYRLRKP